MASLWDKYTIDNLDNKTNFNWYLANTLLDNIDYESICEVGCNIGDNLTYIPDDKKIYGIDNCKSAIDIGILRHPHIHFIEDDITNLKIKNVQYDIVFTRGVLIHIPNNKLLTAIDNVIKCAKKYIIHAEYFGNDGQMIDWKRGRDLLWYRDLKPIYIKKGFNVVADYELNDKNKMHITIIKL